MLEMGPASGIRRGIRRGIVTVFGSRRGRHGHGHLFVAFVSNRILVSRSRPYSGFPLRSSLEREGLFSGSFLLHLPIMASIATAALSL